MRIINPAGAPIGHIHLPERCANLCFGGRNRNRLLMTAAQSLFSLYVNAQGARGRAERPAIVCVAQVSSSRTRAPPP